MIRIQYTNKSAHRVVVPFKAQKQELLALAHAFVTQENSLPLEDRTRYTANIQAALATAQAAHAASASQ